MQLQMSYSMTAIIMSAVLAMHAAQGPLSNMTERMQH